MKLILISIISFLTISICEAKQVTLTLDDNDVKIVENDVPDAVQWLTDAWNGKVNNCKKRMVKTEVDRSIQKSEAIPTGDAAIIQKVLSDPNYKSRKQKDDLIKSK